MLNYDEIEILDDIDSPKIHICDNKENVATKEVKSKNILLFSFLACVLLLIITQIVVFSFVAINNI